MLFKVKIIEIILKVKFIINFKINFRFHNSCLGENIFQKNKTTNIMTKALHFNEILVDNNSSSINVEGIILPVLKVNKNY